MLGLTEALSLLVLTLLASFATWRATNMVNSEDGPFDAFTKFRAYVGLREFKALTLAEKQAWLATHELPDSGMPPRYVHEGNLAARWVECHGCLSVTVAFVAVTYMACVSWVPAAYVPIGTFIVSFGSIVTQLRMR